MTDETQKSLIRLEVEMEIMKRDMAELKATAQKTAESLAEIQVALSMGRGSLATLYRVGWVLVGLAGWIKVFYDMWHG
jgi:hypothetical protein